MLQPLFLSLLSFSLLFSLPFLLSLPFPLPFHLFFPFIRVASLLCRVLVWVDIGWREYVVKAVTGRGNRREMMIRGCRRTERAVFGGWGTVAAQPPSFLRCGLNEGIETKDGRCAAGWLWERLSGWSLAFSSSSQSKDDIARRRDDMKVKG